MLKKVGPWFYNVLLAIVFLFAGGAILVISLPELANWVELAPIFVGMSLLVEPQPGVQFNQIAGMLLFFRLYQIVYSLFGAVFWLRGNIHLQPEPEAVTAESLQGGAP